MSMSDPIADMLTRVRNSQAAGKAAVTMPASKQKTAVAQVLKDNPTLKLSIEGHTDDEGLLEWNQRISKQRAETIKQILIQLGIAAERLSAVGCGPEKPIAPNNTARGRAANRRVEFQIVE